MAALTNENTRWQIKFGFQTLETFLVYSQDIEIAHILFVLFTDGDLIQCGVLKLDM